MNRPWKIWLVFGLCLAVLLAAMGWVSLTAFRLARAEAQAQQQAELEEKVRLALWRMDSMLAPIMAQESARPYFVYNAFYAAERAYGKMFNRLEQGEVLVPSPLLTQVSSNVLLHFQYGPDGRVTSPQVPDSNHRVLAEAQFVTREKIEAAAKRLRQFGQLMAQQAAPEIAHLAGQVPRPSRPSPSVDYQTSPQQEPGVSSSQKAGTPMLLNGDVLLSAAPSPQPGDNLLTGNMGLVVNAPVQQRLQAQNQSKQPAPPSQRSQPFEQQQIARNDEELQARANSVQQAFDVNVKNAYANFRSTPRVNVAEGPVKPIWFGDALVLVRRVIVQGQEYTQGCWLDWAGLQRWLLDGVKDLLPSAHLDPLKNNGADPQARILASLPVRVVPGAARSTLDGLASPILFALVLAWACMILATAAVAVLLHGAVSLSERRGSFVSAVTHELRTPLTTFKMYSEMLAEGMVPEGEQRRHYLTTLCSEANRLSHLVENVLAYARLERGSARRRVERLTLGELVERVKPRLVERAAQAGMKLVGDSDEPPRKTVVHVDAAAVEQILFNLVDNACKYAAPTATEKTIHLEALPTGKFAMLRVRDHGQGISAEGARRLFKPFSKSAHEAAHTAPGVGLGLALCRRLSRSMGGDLRLDQLVKDGACFVLSLPVSTPAP